MATNPRYANGNYRLKLRARFKAQGGECHICRGRLGPIDYTAPSDAAHPLSFVIDEIKPISRWREFGYASPAAAAGDPENTAPAHWICNQAKGASVGPGKTRGVFPSQKISLSDGEW
jgi:hypothetical protein